MDNYLVISLVGPNQPGLVDACSETVRESGCSITDCRMAVMGRQCAMVMQVCGKWSAIVKVEDMLPRLAERWDLEYLTRRTEPRDTSSGLMPYAVEVVAADRVGIVNDIAQFFTSRDISVEDMHCSSYRAAHTETPMFSLHMTISVPSSSSIAALRGDFMELCDHLNLDAIMEPAK